jgi:hypothetical protein
MNKFFFKLRTFFNRLHVIFVTIWVAWEIIGKQSGADTLSSIISSSFSITYSGAIWSMIFLFIISYVLWNYLISSFVDDELILLEKLELNKNELIKNHKEQFKKEQNAVSHLYAIMAVVILIVALAYF